MKLSIITAVLNSHEIVRRQLAHYSKMSLPDNVEVIIVDDESSPSLVSFLGKDVLSVCAKTMNLKIIKTDNPAPWTEHIARNKGAQIASGEYFLMIDIDYILPKETIETVLKFDGDKMNFRRRFGVLDENSDIVFDSTTLKKWGLKRKYRKQTFISGHKSQFVMKREIYKRIRGYRESLDGKAHPSGGGAGSVFIHKWRALERSGQVTTEEHRPPVFMFPVGKFCGDRNFNPLGMFHDLKR